MAWIQVDDTLREHRKTYALADALGIEDYAAVGLTVCLWTWALQNAEGGDLSGFPPRAIARACGWAGNAADLLAALKAAGFIDPDGCIHDWAQYAGRLMDKRAKNRERMRTARTTAEETCACTLPAQEDDACDAPAPCATLVRDLCDARAAHKEDTCAECAGATVQYPNSTVPEINGGGDARACAREEADEADAGLPAIADAHNAVFDAAQCAGFAQTAHDLDKATALMADYTPEWVLEAVSVAADGTKEQRSWRYVEGILKRWKLRGGIDKEPRPETARPVTRSGTIHPIKRVNAQQYTQREYTTEELDNLFEEL